MYQHWNCSWSIPMSQLIRDSRDGQTLELLLEYPYVSVDTRFQRWPSIGTAPGVSLCLSWYEIPEMAKHWNCSWSIPMSQLIRDSRDGQTLELLLEYPYVSVDTRFQRWPNIGTAPGVSLCLSWYEIPEMAKHWNCSWSIPMSQLIRDSRDGQTLELLLEYPYVSVDTRFQRWPNIGTAPGVSLCLSWYEIPEMAKHWNCSWSIPMSQLIRDSWDGRFYHEFLGIGLLLTKKLLIQYSWCLSGRQF